MLSDAQREGLTSPKNLTFSVGLRDLAVQVAGATDPAGMLEEALTAIGASPLPVAEQSRRVTILLKEVPAAIITEPACLERLASLPAHLSTGIASALPPESLSAFFGRKRPSTAGSTPTTSTGGAAKATAVVATAPACVNPIPSDTANSAEDSSLLSAGAAVILLSPADNQQGNKSLLDRAGFAAFRVTTPEELTSHLTSDDVCGFVIDGSFWAGRTPAEQDALLTRVVSYSSLACVFVDRTHFHDPVRIMDVVNGARLRVATFAQFQPRDNSTIREGDLPCFRSAAQLISSGARPLFVPAELTPHELVALTATAAAFHREECGRAGESLRTLTLGTIAGGKSGHKLFLLQFNGQGVPVVAKVGTRQEIWAEVERFNAYVRPYDNLLRPFVHFHCNTAVIVFGLIEDAREPFKLAPTLEARLREIWTGEVWPSEGHDTGRECDGIASIIQRTCAKLELINRQPCAAGGHDTYAYMRGSSLRDMHTSGMKWNLPFPNPKPITECIEAAHRILEPFDSRATVHGDVHLRNILARDVNDAFLIDYSFSGPGHPAHDLARLECCMYFQFLRPLDTEDSFVDLQRAISIECVNAAELERRFESWHSSALNRTLLRGAVHCRDRCLAVLKGYGLGPQDYLAAKFILSCYSVSLPALQLGFVRSTIRALAPEF